MKSLVQFIENLLTSDTLIWTVPLLTLCYYAKPPKENAN